jgi:hypothetical protein
MFYRATVTGGVTWAVSADPIADMLKIKDEVWGTGSLSTDTRAGAK